MNFQAISDELCAGNYGRFDTSQTTQASYWINHAYGLIWAAAPWPWKMAGSQSLTVTANTRITNLWPSGAMTNLRLAFIQDDQGQPLEFMAPQEFFRNYGENSALIAGDSTAKPAVWTMIGDSIYWSAVSDATYTFTAVLEQNIFVRTSAGAVRAGVWATANGTDVPAWNEPFHYAIVLGASATGLAMENDPTAGTLLGMFGQAVDAMVSHFTPHQDTSFQFARDQL